MTAIRQQEQIAERKANATAPQPWRHTRSPSVGSQSQLPSISTTSLHFNSSSNSNSSQKSGPLLLQLSLAIILIVYLFLPSQTIQAVSSKTTISSLSSARKRVAGAISTAAIKIPTILREKKGVSIVAACRNRQATLEKVLSTWLGVQGVDEVVIVDWSSDPPLLPIVDPKRDPRLSLYRVENESAWILSRAYNLAMNASSGKHVIRTDCDYSLKPNFLEAHNLSMTEDGFFSGNWLLARDENEVHLNGAMVIKREAFMSVGGYDERIQTYGWDDEDLYNRLKTRNYTKYNVSYDYVSHFRHGDESRTQTGVKFAQVQIDVNQLLLERLPEWSKRMMKGNESTLYRTISSDRDGYYEMEAIRVPKSLKDQVSEAEYEETWSVALGRRLADDFMIPWDILDCIDPTQREVLLRALMTLQAELDEEPNQGNMTMLVAGRSVPRPTQARVLFVHCMHGLGNRMRALGSALAYANNSKRVPVVIWESDAHLAADFRSLFNRPELVVLDEFKPKWPFKDMALYDSSWAQITSYNYMEMEEGAQKGEVIRNEVDKHIYYKGAYILEAPQYTWWEADNEQLRGMKPNEVVQKHLSSLENQGLKAAIGVHIRNRTLSEDIRNVDFNDEYGAEAVETMQMWRSKSSYDSFCAEMERIVREEDENVRFYIATDTVEVLRRMEQRFPGKILSTSRECDDRDSECLKFALIDMYALSRTKSLLGSNWSSYTEMAERLGGMKARLAGQDFGTGEEPTAATVGSEPEQAVEGGSTENNVRDSAREGGTSKSEPGLAVGQQLQEAAATKSEPELAVEQEDQILDASRER